jgi:hypothetical protein
MYWTRTATSCTYRVGFNRRPYNGKSNVTRVGTLELRVAQEPRGPVLDAGLRALAAQ